MNTIENPNIELFDIDNSHINPLTAISYLNQMGFLLCKRGSISFALDERIYNVRAGDLYIYPAFTYTQIRHFSEDLEGVAVRVDFNFILSSLESMSDTPNHVYIRFHPHVSLTEEQYRRIENTVEYIRGRRAIRTRLGPQVVSAFMHALCYEVIDAYITNIAVETLKQTRKDKIFQSFITLLYKHFGTHRDVSFYAGQLNLTPRYFTTLIHDVSGKTPLQWISMFVIIEAKRLLSNPDISVKEAANRLNFTERSFFGHYFKQYAGCSPSEYKARLLEEE